MSHGIKLLLALCEHADGHKEYLRVTPAKTDFHGEAELVVFGFVDSYTSKYGTTPKWETVLEHGKKEGWDFPLPAANSAPEPPAYYHDKVVERRIHKGLKLLVTDTSNLLNAGDPHKALAHVETVLQAMRMREYSQKIMNFATDAPNIVKAHLMAQALGTSTGLLFGWPYLDGMTGGLLAGDVVSIIGRPAQGKTFALLYAAHYHWAHQQGVPLVISMEMNNLIVCQRLSAMDAKVALTHLKTAQLDKKKQYQPMMAKLKANASKQPFYVVDGQLATTVSQAKMLCQQLKPTSLWIDGAYLMRHENPKLNRWEKVTDNAERIKSDLAEALGIPVVISYQFNRGATDKKHGPPGVENIAYTDAIGQLSSIVLGMSQEDSVETLRKRTISILKGRSGEVGSFDINWKFTNPDPMNFSEWSEPTVAELSYM